MVRARACEVWSYGDVVFKGVVMTMVAEVGGATEIVAVGAAVELTESTGVSVAVGSGKMMGEEEVGRAGTCETSATEVMTSAIMVVDASSAAFEAVAAASAATFSATVAAASAAALALAASSSNALASVAVLAEASALAFQRA